MLSRAFTTRRNKKPEMQISTPSFLGRAASQRIGRSVSRAQISSPVALLSTSNVLLNNAQSIMGTAPIEYVNASSASSISSGSAEDSGASTSNGSIHSTETGTDASSIDESPIEPKHNHLSCYFNPGVDTQSIAPSLSPRSSKRQLLDTPSIPQRASSHSKKAHEGLHRKNSIKRMLSPPPARNPARSSTDLISATTTSFVEAPTDSPFGRELAQLDAVAEEFGQVVNNAEVDADEVAMKSFDLAAFGASDYLFEIQSLIHEMLEESEPIPAFGGWI